jgi:hypothetical protein
MGMKRAVLLLASMVLAVLLACGLALAQTSPINTLDANHEPSVRYGWAPISSAYERAQTFTAINSGQITSAQARGSIESGEWYGFNQSANITIEITGVNSTGVPSNVLATTTASISDDGLTATGDFTGDSVAVEAGQQYALNLTSSSSIEAGYWLIGNSKTGNNYPGGMTCHKGSFSAWEWSCKAGQDTSFAIYVMTEDILAPRPVTEFLSSPAHSQISLS